MYKDLLPIGSVVALQGATRKLLIIGTCLLYTSPSPRDRV